MNQSNSGCYFISMKIKSFLLLLFIACFCIVSYSQSLPNNFSNLTSAAISDAQLSNLIKQMASSGYRPEQFFELAVARGMNAAEAKTVQDRITKLSLGMSSSGLGNKQSNNGMDTGITRVLNGDTSVVQSQKPPVSLIQSQLYGADIFNNSNLTFEPNLRIATPVNYIIGPDDEIVVIISGYQEYNNRFKVNPEGFITIPNVGVIYVAGLTFEAASKLIKDKLIANGYSNIRTGLTKVNITLGSIRSIKVTLLGEVTKPGTYTLPSLATVFNALYASGGPSERGSFRNIEVIRNNKVIDTLDIYDFLSHGDLHSNILLADQDIIRIPVYTKRVTLKGAFKRTGIFEVKNGETLQDIIGFAGGFTDEAATDYISAIRLTSTQRMVVDIPETQFSSFVPRNADQYTVNTILNRYENRVQISGAVFSPGTYAWQEGLTVKDLLQKAKGIKEDAYLAQGYIRRLQSDNFPSAIDFNVADVLSGKATIPLQREDSVVILSDLDLRQQLSVFVDGAVAKPDSVLYINNLTLQDAILQAGGFTLAASNKIEISRRTKNGNPLDTGAAISEIIEVMYDSTFFSGGNTIKLEPFDRILVKTNPSFILQQQVIVNGEVLYPGSYTLQTKTETASSLIMRSGGLLPTANAGSAYILRLRDNATEIERRRHLEAITSNDKEVYITNDMLSSYDKFILDLNDIRNHPNTVQDVVLKPGDVLVINQLNNNVKVSGQVYNPSISVYEPDKSVLYYVNRAGGYAPYSKKKNTLVLYPNGEAKKIRHFLFFRSLPHVEPGSEVIVPKEQPRDRNRLTTSEIVAITGSVASLAAVVIALLNFTK